MELVRMYPHIQAEIYNAKAKIQTSVELLRHTAREAMNNIRRLLILAIFCGLIDSAAAGEATCRDYIRVRGEDRSLLNGFIYGFVSAKIGDRGDAEVNTATERVKQLADKYCQNHPDDRFTRAITSFMKIVSQYGSGGNSPPSPRDTHRECEELALKLAYPRQLNGCKAKPDTCKQLTEKWLDEAVIAKKECLHKKLGVPDG